MRILKRSIWLWSFMLGLTCRTMAGEGAPTVFWASDPVRPGETVLVTGDGLTAGSTVELFRLQDGAVGQEAKAVEWPGEVTRLTPLQPRDVSLKFLLPTDGELGVFAVRIRNGGGVSKTFLLNVPDPWWCQGDMGTKATAGGKVRVLGKNLGQGEAGAQRERAGTVLLKGPKAVTLPADGNGYSLVAALPPDLPAGRYELRVHSGLGGPQAWSKPLTLELMPPDVWPALTVNVMEMGATGRGVVDDTKAIAAALEKLQANGGGVLYFPRGRYLVSDTLKIPERTVLRGERRDLCCIAWPDQDEPLSDMLMGTHSFAIEELSFYCGNYGNFLSTDVESPQAGNIRLHRLRVVANRYRGHMWGIPKATDKTPGKHNAQTMLDRFVPYGPNRGKLLSLGGGNLEVTDCDFLASGFMLYLRRPRAARIAGNVFRLGRFGGYWLAGCDGVVCERNRFLGQDLSSWGGSICCLDGSTYCQHVYYEGNVHERWFGGDNELTSDPAGGSYFGKAAKTEGVMLTTAEDPNWGQRDWRGAVVLVMGGKGVGQYRRIVKASGRTVEVDRPWDLPPDDTSQLCISLFQGDHLLLNNRFTDIGVIQWWAISINNICDGNVSTRTAGFFNFGKRSRGVQLVQPSWSVQWLNNVIEEGNGYDSAHYQMPRDATLGVMVQPPTPDFPYALSLGTVVRNNRLSSNAAIRIGQMLRDASSSFTVGANALPCLQDVIVEGNHVQDNDTGIEVAPGVQGVCLRGNYFERVEKPLLLHEPEKVLLLPEKPNPTARQQ